MENMKDFQIPLREPLLKFRIKTACKPDGRNDLIMIFGESSSGKSSLAACLTEEFEKKGVRVRCMQCEELINMIINTILASKLTSELVDELTEYDLIIIDEMELIKGKEGTQHEVVNIVNELSKRGKKVIIMGLPGSSDYYEIMSNAKWFGLRMKEISLPCLNRLDRMIFIMKKAHIHGLKIGLSEMWSMSEISNLREIIGALNKKAAKRDFHFSP